MTICHQVTGSTSPLTAAAYGEPHLTVATRGLARAAGQIHDTELPRPLVGVSPGGDVLSTAADVVAHLQQQLSEHDLQVALRAAACDLAAAWFDTAQGVAVDAATDAGPVGTYTAWAAALAGAADHNRVGKH